MTDLANTDLVTYHLQRASILLDPKKHQQAAGGRDGLALDPQMTAAHEALAISPEDASAHEMLGDIHVELKEGAEAFACFGEALRLDPNNKAIKRKVTLSMQARLPVIRWFWRLGQESSWGHRVLWALFAAMTVFLQAQTGSRDPDLVVIYVVFDALIVLWRLFL